MMPLSDKPGLITHIDNKWMHVKVPVGSGCAACPNRSKCTFSGPDRAYRSFRVRRVAGCKIGDRVLVQVPGAILGVAALVFVLLPVSMIAGGYALLECCLQIPYATLLLWLLGIAVWIGIMIGANRWMEHSARFQERVQPVSEQRSNAERIEDLLAEGRR